MCVHVSLNSGKGFWCVFLSSVVHKHRINIDILIPFFCATEILL